jgi:putative ABC transport system ATP-binding protein
VSLLELQEVSKSYGKGPAEIHAVQDIDLPADAGALVAVMGRADRANRPLLTIAVSWRQRVWRN